QSRLNVDNADAYRAACIAGLGLAQVPVYDTAAQIAAGRLRTLLLAFRPAPLPVCALYPQQRHGARALRAFIEWMAALFAGDPLLCGATV
ncbi:MAG: LysR family transcriptional regulator, partial [Lysobacterales bacterium]